MVGAGILETTREGWYQGALTVPRASDGRAAWTVGERAVGYVSSETSRESGRGPTPDAGAGSDPDDALYELGERCAEAYMQADALHHRAMTLLAEFHRRDGWKEAGFSSTADWLAWRVSIKPGAARERVRTALALEHLPETSRAMANGELSFTKVRALTRVATADNEQDLLELARSGSAANLERVVRAWKQLDRRSEVDAEQLRYRSRRASAFVGDDGMVVVRARLDPEAGAMFMRAVEVAADALFKGDPEVDPARRRADAVGLIAERALAAGFAPDDDAPVSGSRADRTQVVLHVDEATLTEDRSPAVPSSTTAPAFPRKRHGEPRATRGWCG